MMSRIDWRTCALACLLAVAALGCSKPLSPTEEAFLGTWEAVFTDEDETVVRIVWTFESLHEGDRTVWNEIHRDDQYISRRKGEWRVVDARTLRVVLDSETLSVTDQYDDSSNDDEGVGQLFGSLIGEMLKALTDDEYTIEYGREGDAFRMRWYNEDFHTYERVRNRG